MRARHPPRGFTLVELLVGAAVGALVLTAVGLVFISQAHQYQAHASRRAAQASARQAMAFVEQHLRSAGYGVDPDRALFAYDSYDAARDRQEAGFPDGLTVHARDPYFRRRAMAVASDSLQLDAPPPQPLPRGQILLVLCPGAFTYAYVTVGEPPPSNNPMLVRLDTSPPADFRESPVGPPGSFFRKHEELAQPCFHGEEKPWVVKINRASFYVASFDEGLPYLMLHQGVDLNGDDRITAEDASPVAVGIEQLQVAYILNAEGQDEPTLVGVNDMVPWGESWQQAQEPPRMDGSYRSPRRFTRHPANIRQVRLTLVARSALPDRERPGDDALVPGAPWARGPRLPSSSDDNLLLWRQLENLTLAGASPAPAFDPRGGGYSRTVVRQSIAPKNLLMRSQFIPLFNDGGG
jgi:type IV pilus assembly protein PilW